MKSSINDLPDRFFVEGEDEERTDDHSVRIEHLDGEELVYRVGDHLTIWPDRYRVRVGKETIDLTPTEMRTLVLLADRPGRVWSRLQIVKAIHDGDLIASDRSVNLIVHRLRRKLKSAGGVLETVQRHGYRFNAARVRASHRLLGLVTFFVIALVFDAACGRLTGRAQAATLAMGGLALGGGGALLLDATDTVDLPLPFVGLSRPIPHAVHQVDAGQLDLSGLVGRYADGLPHASLGGFAGITGLGSDRYLVASAARPSVDPHAPPPPARLHEYRITLDPTKPHDARFELMATRTIASLEGVSWSADASPSTDDLVPSIDPRGITRSPTGMLWLADASRHRLVELTPDAIFAKSMQGVNLHEDRDGFERVSIGSSEPRFVDVAATADAWWLIAAPRSPLAADGGVTSRWLRLTQFAWNGSARHEFAYRLDESYHRIAAVIAETDRTLLVLETDTGKVPGHRFAKVFRVSIAEASDTVAVDAIPAEPPGWLQPAAKTAILDLSEALRALPAGVNTVQFADMTPGPRLPSGRRSLLLVTNNRHDPDVASCIVLLPMR